LEAKIGKEATQTTLTLDIHRTSIVLSIEISTTDTKTLLDSRAMGNFIDKDFVHTKGMSIWSISRPIPVYNVDGSSNKVGQISEVVDVVLCYKTHSERMLLTISSFRKQSMILSYIWFKDHNRRSIGKPDITNGHLLFVMGALIL